jgi:hypothetical protein
MILTKISALLFCTQQKRNCTQQLEEEQPGSAGVKLNHELPEPTWGRTCIKEE